MTVDFVKVYYTPPNGSEQDITEWTGLQNKRGLQIKDAKCELSINNSRYKYKEAGESIFQEDGDVAIYADNSPITKANNQLLLQGQIQEIGHSRGENGSITKLSVSDKTNLLLSGVWGFTYEDETVDSIVKSVVNNAPSANNEVTTNNVATTTTTGAAFPSIDMAKVMKPVYEWLTDLSQPGITGEDKAYLFYVDKDNDLHWFYPSSTVDSTITEGTDEIYNVSMKKSQDELVNMIIYNAGQDLKGNGNLWYYYDTLSKSNKLRMKYQPFLDIGRDLFEKELLAGNVVESSGGSFHYQGKDYNASGYPLTPTWPSASSVSNDSDYNDAFRLRQREIAGDNTQNAPGKSGSIIQAFSGLRWKGTIELKGTHGFTAGDLLTVDLPTEGILSQQLRVWDVQQSFGNDGWITGLELREDEEALQE